jgi:Cell division protein FtsI/penicillin-binding protein 2
MQAVHDIGSPGLLFGPREMRLYPNGSLAAHILGGTRYGREGVSSAEVIGVAGVERQFDPFLRDPPMKARRCNCPSTCPFRPPPNGCWQAAWR